MTLKALLIRLIYLITLLVIFPLITWLLILEEKNFSHRMLDGSMLVMCFSVIVFSAIRITVLALKLPERIMAVCFYSFIYIWLGLIPLYQLGTEQLSWRTVLPIEYYHLAFVIVFIGLLFYEIGYLFPKNRSDQLYISAYTPPITKIIVLSLIAVALALWFGPITTPIELLMSDRTELASGLSGTDGDRMARLMTLAVMRSPIFVALLVVLWRWRMDSQNRIILSSLLLLIIPVFLIVNFPTAISRTWLGTIVISVTVVFILTSRRRSADIFPLVLLIGLLTLYPLAHYARSAAVGIHSGIGESILSTYSAGSFDVFAMIAHSIRYLDEVKAPVSFGFQLLGPFLFWVPRSIWERKPVGSGSVMAEELGFPFANVSAPLWSEGLINFHVLGVMLFFLSFGWLSRKLELASKQRSQPTTLGVVIAFMSGFQFIILRGDLLTVSTLATPFLACVFLFFYTSMNTAKYKNKK